MSVPPNSVSRTNTLFVTTWLAVLVALVTVISSSNVRTKSNVPLSATAPSAQSIDNKFPDSKFTERFRIATKISGSASALSLPVAAEAVPGCITHPLSVAVTNSREYILFESIGRLLGLLSSPLVFPHIAILISFYKSLFFVN